MEWLGLIVLIVALMFAMHEWFIIWHDRIRYGYSYYDVETLHEKLCQGKEKGCIFRVNKWERRVGESHND